MTSGSTIEINGRRYDALTGQQHPGANVSPSYKKPVNNTGVAMDGMVRTKHIDTGQKHVRHAAAKSKTLMRHAVRKPVLAKPQIDRRSLPINGPAAKPEVTDGGFRFGNASRASRAGTVNKSSLINKFSDFKANTYQSMQSMVRTAPMPVVKQPVENYTPTHSGTPARRPADALVEKALLNAAPHEQKPAKKPGLRARTARKFGTSTKIVSVTAGCLAVLLLGTFFAYQNVPNFAMRVAAARSGVKATLPGYRPSGFAFKSKVNYSAGQVTVTFKANADDRNYSIIQKNSSWNSDALLTNYVASSGSMYQTYQDQGRTIYIYKGTNATWVNGGIWYEISGNSSLNSEQLVRIATSM